MCWRNSDVDRNRGGGLLEWDLVVTGGLRGGDGASTEAESSKDRDVRLCGKGEESILSSIRVLVCSSLCDANNLSCSFW